MYSLCNWYGGHSVGFFGIGMIINLLIFIAISVLIVLLIFKLVSKKNQNAVTKDNEAVMILKKRLAAGKITKEQYDEMKSRID